MYVPKKSQLLENSQLTLMEEWRGWCATFTWLLTQPLHSSEQLIRANLEFSSNFVKVYQDTVNFISFRHSLCSWYVIRWFANLTKFRILCLWHVNRNEVTKWRNDEMTKYYVICAAVSALSWLSQFCTSKKRLE